jgi:hypothetical protein
VSLWKAQGQRAGGLSYLLCFSSDDREIRSWESASRNSGKVDYVRNSFGGSKRGIKTKVFRGGVVRVKEKVYGCDASKSHGGPFYSINIIAYEVGLGVFPKGKKRKLHRIRVGRICKQCLQGSRLDFRSGERVFLMISGSHLFLPKATDPAGDC